MDVTKADLTFAVLSKSLDLLSARQEAISANIANVNTPGYARRDVDFTTAIREALSSDKPLSKSGRLAAVEGVSPSVISEAGLVSRNDKGGVDIDKEMAEEARTQLLYSASVNLMDKRDKMYKMVIMDGRA